MKKSISSLLLASIAFAPSIYGWGVKNMEPETPPGTLKMGGVNNPEIHLHGDDENGYVKFSYLLFRPHLDNTAFTARNTNPFGQFGDDASIKPKSPDFDWSSGARVSVGAYLPNYDFWDLGFTVSFFYSEADNELSTEPVTIGAPVASYLTPQFFQGVLGDFPNEASGNWRMNFFTYDLGLAREYFLTPKITARPYLGLRGMTLYQKFSSHYSSVFFDNAALPTTQTADTKMSATQENWGIGVKAATDIAFQLPSHFAIFGNVGASILYGHYDNRENFEGRVHPLLAPYNPKVFNHGFDAESSIEGSLGFKWEKWFPENSNRICLSFCFEAQRWFNINRLMRVDVNSLAIGATNFPMDNVVDLTGDLTLMGFTFALQWDF